jgi:hypothetical protein
MKKRMKKKKTKETKKTDSFAPHLVCFRPPVQVQNMGQRSFFSICPDSLDAWHFPKSRGERELIWLL